MRLLPRLLLTALAAGSPLALQAAAADEVRRPNVVFVLVDDMGYADAGSLGSTDLRTPHIDRLAREGVRFTDFYANAPVCTPTRAAFITGRYQQRAGLEWAMGFSAEQQRRVGDRWVSEPDKLALGLPATEPSLARSLKSAGYGTAIFGKWHLGFRPEYNPLRHGFDEYFGVLLGHADYYSYRYFDGTYHLVEKTQPAQAKGYLTDLISQRAVGYIDRQGKKPFFLYVPYNAVHWPFQVPDRPDQVLTEANKYAGTRRDYIAMMERVDQGVGQLLAALERQGVADDTLFIFSSDNGGERLSNNAPLFSHKTTLVGGRDPRPLPDALARPSARGQGHAPTGDHHGPDRDHPGGRGRQPRPGPRARRHRPAADRHRQPAGAGTDVLLARGPHRPQAESGQARPVEVHAGRHGRDALQP